MSALPELLITVGLTTLLLYLSRRRRPPLVTGLLRMGLLVVWLYCAYSALALALWAVSPPGIGADNWPELWVNLAVTIGLPLVLLRRWLLTPRPGDVPDGDAGT
jgi:hypothetical protein